MRLALALVPTLIAAAQQAGAAETFRPPEGCEATLSVQYSDCTTTLDWQCTLAPEGDTWSAFFDADGLQSIVSFDGNGGWLDAVFLWDGSREEAVGQAVDPVNVNHLLEAGADSYDFTIRRTDETGARRMRVTGEDLLTGEAVTIDGTRLLRTRYTYRMQEPDGTLYFASEGEQYVDPVSKQYFLGNSQQTSQDETWRIEAAPVEIIHPGEPGFAATQPTYGCTGSGASKAAFVP